MSQSHSTDERHNKESCSCPLALKEGNCDRNSSQERFAFFFFGGMLAVGGLGLAGRTELMDSGRLGINRGRIGEGHLSESLLPLREPSALFEGDSEIQ